MDDALIIFVRNPISGQVKSRLAATMGKEKALAVYEYLLRHTKKIIAHLQVQKFVFYADFVNENDLWNGCTKKLQEGNDLGERMKNAFETVFNAGFKKASIIGSDCYDLTEKIVAEAFENLYGVNTIIGPATDGGYYLLGMQAPLKNVFENILWGSGEVYAATKKIIEQQGFSLHILETLKDVDEEKDINFIF